MNTFVIVTILAAPMISLALVSAVAWTFLRGWDGPRGKSVPPTRISPYED